MASRFNSPLEPLQTTDLPLELVLLILELAARTWINVHPCWAASLQLISHASRAAIEPIIYRVFAVERSQWHDGNGLWSQPRDAQRLAQMLANDTPRFHHLILGVDALDAFRTLNVPTRSVARLSIVAHRSPKTLPEYLSNPLKVTGNKTELVHCGCTQLSNTYVDYNTWEHARFWVLKESRAGFPIIYEFFTVDAPGTDEDRSSVAGKSLRYLHIELGDQETFSIHTMRDIADILQQSDQHNVHIVIVCSRDYKSPWGLGIDETMQLLDASRTLPATDWMQEKWCAQQHLSIALNHWEFQILHRARVKPDSLYSRLRVSHALWGCDGPGWVGSWYGRAVERGDVWDEGRPVQRLVTR